MHNYYNNYGCDSILIYKIHIFPKPISSISLNGSPIICNDDSIKLTSSLSSSYLWNNGATTQSIFTSNSGTFYVIITDSNNCSSTSSILTTSKKACPIFLHLKAYLQGFYIGPDSLKPVINPVDFPDISDIITVELHNSTPPFSTFYISSGIITSNGYSDIYFPSQVYNKTLYIVLKHRNSLATWSKFPVRFNYSDMYYDFTTNPDKSYGNNLVTLFDGKLGIYSGDVNQDGFINRFCKLPQKSAN